MTRVAINGFGRIGRNFLRASLERRPGFEIVAVNDLGDLRTMAHLLQFDSVLGRLSERGRRSTRTRSPSASTGCEPSRSPSPRIFPGGSLVIDVVVESTGRFTKRDKAQAHLDAGAETRRDLGGCRTTPT